MNNRRITLNELRQAHWAVLGFGREAQALVRVMKARWPDGAIHVYCEQTPTLADDLPFSVQNDDNETGDQLHVGPFEHTDFDHYQVLVKSPGISPLHPGLIDLPESISVTSTTNLWFAERPDQRVIAITGSKGKSTTSALLHHVLQYSGVKARLVGNIGLPLIEQLEAQADCWVLELSSYQTRDLQACAEVGVVLSLFPDHLDWHGGEHAYFRDKLKLLNCCKQPWIPQDLRPAIVHWMPEWQQPDQAPPLVDILTEAGIHPGKLGVMDGDQCLMPTYELPLVGAHNLRNLCVAWTLARYWGISDQEIRSAVGHFQALPHRLQNLGPIGLHVFINDSISTTPQASIAALSAFSGIPTTILIGGHDRGVDWSEFADYVAQQAPQAIIAMGAHGRRIVAVLEARACEALKSRVHWAENLSQAVSLARQVSVSGSYIVLSPGAPSYGEFTNFEARGHAFKVCAEQSR
jgi:UDP-N-acetylmuramoylalanine--D-glutamate ligase